MSVVTLSSASIRNTSVRLGEPVESEKFRQRRLRIRQWEHEQSLEDMAAIRMIQQLCDSSIVPSSSVKTEFSDLDGLSWDRSSGRADAGLHAAQSLVPNWETRVSFPKSASLTLPRPSTNLTIVASASYDGLPSPSTTPTPTVSKTFVRVHPHNNTAPCVSYPPLTTMELSYSNSATIRPRPQPVGSAPSPLTILSGSQTHHSLPVPPLHYYHLAQCQPQPQRASVPNQSSLPIPTRTRRIRTSAAGPAAVILPLKTQRDLTIRPNFRRGKSGGKNINDDVAVSGDLATVAA